MPIAVVIVYQTNSVAEMTTRKTRTVFAKDVAVDRLLYYIRSPYYYYTTVPSTIHSYHHLLLVKCNEEGIVSHA